MPSAAASAAPAVPGEGAGSQAGSSPGTVDNNLQIVYTGSLEMVVADVPTALAKAKNAVSATGGYIGASQESNNADQPTAVITYRIPASKWEDTITQLGGLATKVVAEQTQATEVGSQLVDLNARITNLRASESALQDIAKSTAKVSDLLEVQAQLTDVRGQIEELSAQQQNLQGQVAYGTLVTTFGLEAQQVKVAAKGWDPATDVDGATATLISAGQKIVSAAIWFGIVWVPILAVMLIALFIVWRLWRRFGPKPIVPAGPVDGWTGGAPPPAA